MIQVLNFIIKKQNYIFMKKNSITYNDLSKKQLEYLKESYIQKKVEEMSNKELKEFVLEVISHQINETIGKEEEMEAWDEMSTFFGEQFEMVILEIQKKFENNGNNQTFEEDTHQDRLKLLEKNKFEDAKKDMWDD